MSVWTRVECKIIVPRPVTDDELISVFGKEFDDGECPSWNEVSFGRITEEEYDRKFIEWSKRNQEVWADYKEHEDQYLPTGSEGSLAYGKSSRAEDGRYVYMISGSLRDWADDEYIVKWFRDKFLNWCIHSDIDKDFEAYGLVKASMGVGELQWKYGFEKLTKIGD